jgi:hypothetical protein
MGRLSRCCVHGLVGLALAGCGKSGSPAFDELDAGSPGAPDDGATSVDAPQQPVGDAGGSLRLPDAGVRDAAHGDGSACSFGSAASIATSANLNLFGQIVYYEDGGAFPAGRYRASYTDGCMKYDYIFGWTVQGSGPDAGGGFWLVSKSTTDLVVKPPGIVGGIGGYATFDECVAANLAMDLPVEFDFDGGPLGVWLDDNPYLDNVAGDNGRNPAWSLVYLQACPPNLGVPVPQ